MKPWWELPSWWARWVAFWDQEEHPRALGLLRWILGCIVLTDFANIYRLDLVVTLFGTEAVGGLSDATSRADLQWWYRVMPDTADTAWALYLGMVLFASTFTVGLFTRLSAFGLMLLWTQQSLILPPSDRGIDMLCRNILCILAFSQAGTWAGVDGWLAARRGQVAALIPAWPRYLVILQLVVMYWTAGVQKVGLEWTPMGSFSALYVIMQDPAVVSWDFSFLAKQPFYLLTQLATLSTMLWQWSYPIVLLFYWYEYGPQRGGRLRELARRYHPKWVWIAIGAFFHVQLAATLELGIFPWAMMSLYPAFFHPDELGRLFDRLRGPRQPSPDTTRA